MLSFQCWVQDLSVFFVFFVTLTCFPAIQAGIERVSDDFILNSKSITKISRSEVPSPPTLNWCLPTYFGASWLILLHPNLYWCLPTYIGASWLTLVHSDLYWCLMLVQRHQCRLGVHSDLYWCLPTYIGASGLTLVHPNLSQPTLMPAD